MTFYCAEEPLCHLWLQTLQDLLRKLSTWMRRRRGPRGTLTFAAPLPFALLPITKHTGKLVWLKNPPVYQL